MPALFAGMSMGPLFGDRRRPHQFRADRRVQFRERMDDFLRRILGDDLSGIRLAVRISKTEFFGGCQALTMSYTRGQRDNSSEYEKARGTGDNFRHKKRPISSRIAAFATGFLKKHAFERSAKARRMH